MAAVLVYFLAGLLLGALLVGLTAVLILRRWRQTAGDLESQLRSHSFELQIALDELTEANRQLEIQTQIDALSGVYNRAYFDRQLTAELKRSRREQRSLALVLLDIDHFKQINDNHGHLVGDQAIKQVAQLIRQHVKRPADKVFRYGGEEFALVLPNTSLEGAVQLAECIRQQLTATSINTAAATLTLSLSAGCYAAIPAKDSDNDEFIAFADKTLYRAKAAGRDQVQSYPTPVVVAAVTGEIHEH
ncbi:MAG: GGDEF domain-containing protein [Chromatiaceae bacterium]|nr:GGDEF domain-containing protein [Chromatiaceae bacterium]